LGRSFDPERRDPNDGPIVGGKYTIIDTRTDQFDFARAKAQAEDAIAKYPELDAMVGLFGYNPPKCLEAIKEAGKQGEIKVIAFDEEDDTLQGIKDGFITGTIVQNPYRYGYESVRVLTSLARGDESVIPDSKFIDIPARKINIENVDAFWTELKQLRGQAE
jgi:ribose transport system substrate-binding protein